MACTVDIDSVVETYEFALAELGSKREAMAVALDTATELASADAPAEQPGKAELPHQCHLCGTDCQCICPDECNHCPPLRPGERVAQPAPAAAPGYVAAIHDPEELPAPAAPESAQPTFRELVDRVGPGPLPLSVLAGSEETRENGCSTGQDRSARCYIEGQKGK